jgi:hypothetical protein
MVQAGIRLPDDVHARLTAQAEADRRSLNSEIIHLIEVALSAVGRERRLYLPVNGGVLPPLPITCGSEHFSESLHPRAEGPAHCD